jgi:hypothetical protein
MPRTQNSLDTTHVSKLRKTLVATHHSVLISLCGRIQHLRIKTFIRQFLALMSPDTKAAKTRQTRKGKLPIRQMGCLEVDGNTQFYPVKRNRMTRNNSTKI